MAEPQRDTKIAEFERHYEREAARIKRLLDELCASKLIPVSVVATKGADDDNGPMFITLRIDHPEIASKGAPRGSYH